MKYVRKLTIKTWEWHHWRRSQVSIVNFRTYFTPCSCVSIVNFEQVKAVWVGWFLYLLTAILTLSVKFSVSDIWSSMIFIFRFLTKKIIKNVGNLRFYGLPECFVVCYIFHSNSFITVFLFLCAFVFRKMFFTLDLVIIALKSSSVI